MTSPTGRRDLPIVTLGGSDLCRAYSAELITGLVSSSRIDWVRFNGEKDGADGNGRRSDGVLFRAGLTERLFIFWSSDVFSRHFKRREMRRGMNYNKSQRTAVRTGRVLVKGISIKGR
jgi:hypothetical protein